MSLIILICISQMAKECWMIFHVLLDYIYFFFCEVSIHYFCLFIIRSHLVVQDLSSLYSLYLENFFLDLYLVSWLLFHLQNRIFFSNLIKINLLILVISFAIIFIFRESLLIPMLSTVFLVFLSSNIFSIFVFSIRASEATTVFLFLYLSLWCILMWC